MVVSPQPLFFARGPQEMFDRRHPAQHLLDGASDFLRVGAELSPLIRIFQEGKETAGGDGGRRVVPGLAITA